MDGVKTELRLVSCEADWRAMYDMTRSIGKGREEGGKGKGTEFGYNSNAQRETPDASHVHRFACKRLGQAPSVDSILGGGAS
jgi:hypothetical protein